MSAMLEYSEINSPIHKLTGATKLICLVIWALASMVTYDTRILVVMVICSIAIFKISKVEFKTVSFVFYLILVFLLINNIAIFLFSPLEGTYIYGSRTDLFHIAGPYTVTTEQLFYQLNIDSKEKVKFYVNHLEKMKSEFAETQDKYDRAIAEKKEVTAHYSTFIRQTETDYARYLTSGKKELEAYEESLQKAALEEQRKAEEERERAERQIAEKRMAIEEARQREEARKRAEERRKRNGYSR